MDKLIHEMTSQELFDLAKLRRNEEAQLARKELRDELNNLRHERRDLEKEYKIRLQEMAISAFEGYGHYDQLNDVISQYINE